MKTKKEIIERSSGYWIVDDTGAIDGAFIDYDEAYQVLLRMEQNG